MDLEKECQQDLVEKFYPIDEPKAVNVYLINL